jgi:diaminohydroxyphosphoribosylaminopyrimidine deaminase/5-amino-6-(5-phosphoribosylamino)uracil reductase
VPPTAAEDERFMAAALTLAGRSLGTVWPNPAVGCLIVQGGRIAGRGFTQPGGRPHAETIALAAAGPAARGATAYITLEPCAHHGQTPPCADALVAAGVARVVSALEDPDPRVAGRGFARLRAAGVRVETGVMASAAGALNLGFLTRLARGRPMVTLKLAVTLDGRIATARGESRWITGPEARRLAHLMRAQHDAILVGAGTVRADDPLLDVRDIGMADRAPVRVVADGSLSLPLTSRLARTAARQPLWIFHAGGADAGRAAALRACGAVLIPCPAGAEGRLDTSAMLGLLAERGLTRLLCEGGGRLAGSLLAARVVDRLVTAVAGLVIGGDGTAGVGALGLARLADAPRFRLVGQRQAGADLFTFWEAG